MGGMARSLRLRRSPITDHLAIPYGLGCGVGRSLGIGAGRGVGVGRIVAMWMIWETGSKSLREIGELFGGLDYAAVAQRICRTRSNHDAAATQKLIHAILSV